MYCIFFSICGMGILIYVRINIGWYIVLVFKRVFVNNCYKYNIIGIFFVMNL